MVHSCQCACIHQPHPNMDHWIRKNPEPSETPRSRKVPEESDLCPSVSLAALLVLIFILVVFVLLPAGAGRTKAMPLGHIGGRLVRLHPLFLSQSLATRWALESSLRPDRDGLITVAAVAKNDATQTLICFCSNVISLLSRQSETRNATKRLRDYKPENFSWVDGITRSSGSHRVAVVTQRVGQAPYGIILGQESDTTGGRHFWELTLSVPSVKNEGILHGEGSDVASKLLRHLHATRWNPKTFKEGLLPEDGLRVLQIIGDPYLENGFVC
ncbi:uncharacterized protein LOC128503553 [Spea bombifrons]|uniref:uncharacterized protein LOC128503553 n=1 Tax=Spea bombifrons TaxID=233779 RepID=UPI00234A254E|nr:uncharacterized protein LOC128503553 [Spea bombifrons]